MDLTPKILEPGTNFCDPPHFFPGGSNNFFQRVGQHEPPIWGDFWGLFWGGQGGEEEDRKQQLYKNLRVFAKTPDSPAHAGNYVKPSTATYSNYEQPRVNTTVP